LEEQSVTDNPRCHSGAATQDIVKTERHQVTEMVIDLRFGDSWLHSVHSELDTISRSSQEERNSIRKIADEKYRR
jgi:hypothetical protein